MKEMNYTRSALPSAMRNSISEKRITLRIGCLLHVMELMLELYRNYTLRIEKVLQ